ncbi:hypothetical protein [Streptomyces sp. YIM S03343]
MPRSLRRKLLRHWRRARADVQDAVPQLPEDRLPVRPTERQLGDAISAAEAPQDNDADELARLLLAVDRDGDPELLAATAQLLLRAGPRVWFLLDTTTRRAWWPAPHWSATAIQRLAQGESSYLGLATTACHPDGRVREAAVARLAELNGPLAMPSLALRAADWVPQVRDRARKSLEQQLAEPSAATLLAVAPVALALSERREGRWLADRVESAFREGPIESLAAALAAPDRRTRRIAYLTGLAADRLDLPQLLRAAEYDDDPLTRTRCAEAAVRKASAAGSVDAVRPLLTSGTAAVRAEAVHALARAGDITPAVTALADRSPTVRAVAQAALRRAGSFPAENYRRLVVPPLPAPGAIAGLGETGAADDAALVLPWLDHPRPRGRAEAVRALRRLGAAGPDTVTTLLTDPSGAVTRQVTRALLPWASRLDLRHLQALLAQSNAQHIRMAAYRLLHERDVWTRLLTDLELFTDPSPMLRNGARSDLKNWLTREAATTYSMPRGPTAEALTRQLTNAEPVLTPDQLRLLRFHLGIRHPAS